MIKDIQELNFPKSNGKQYVTLSQATANIADMGEKNIIAQVKIDGDIRPDFSYDWAVVFQGEKYIMPLRKPQGAKGNESLNSEIDLTFQHWAIYQLKRWMFVTMQPIETGTAVADKYIASISLNLGDFCTLFRQVLSYYYGNTITIDLNPAWQYRDEPTAITISHTKIWNVLIDTLQPLYGVRWEIVSATTNNNAVKDGERYVIRVGYPTTEIAHIFEYGFKGGLLKVERQVQSDEICNMLIGRGGSKNLPYRYFKNTDPNNPSFKADPDWIPELANIYFDKLRGATFRSYVQGWKANHYGGTTTKESAYAPWAWEKGYTDTKFDPVEYVKDDASIAEYGPLLNGLEDNEDIFPTIQGVIVEPYGRIDEVVDVETIESDDYASDADSDVQIETIKPCTHTVSIGKGLTEKFTKAGWSFTIPEGKIGNLTLTRTVYNATRNIGFGYGYDNGLIVEKGSILYVVNESTHERRSPVNIPAGNWYYESEITVENTSSSMSLFLSLTAYPELSIGTDTDNNKWKNTWNIWIKNVWGTSKGADETDDQYAERVWNPILGDREKNEAKVVFSDGMLSTSSDYEFIIPKGLIPQYDPSKSLDGVQSHWRITLGKSDADLESIGLYVPSTMRFAEAGDHFFFIGIDMPHQYVVWGEERVDDYKADVVGKKKDIKPTWVVSLDKVRMANKQEGEVATLISQLKVGSSLRLADKRFIGKVGTNAYETLYLQSITYTYGNTIIPDVDIVLSDEYAITANPISLLQDEVSSIQKQLGSISNLEQAIRAVADKLYLRKDGINDRSLSPTQFWSLLSSKDFRNGIIDGLGWGFYKNEDGLWVLEADQINARHELHVNNLVVNQITAQGGKAIESAASMIVTNVIDIPDGYICYFDQKMGTVANLFHLDDIAMGQVFDPKNIQTRFYKRRVIAIDIDSITLSKTDVFGNGIPMVGDLIVHYGNYNDPARQYVKVRDVIGGGYERYIDNLNSVETGGTEYYFVGRQSGQYEGKPRWFIGDTDNFIEYRNGKLLINGSLQVGCKIGDLSVKEYIESTSKEYLQNDLDNLENKYNELQDQMDGVVEAWSFPYTPTLQNYPASEWTTDGQKQAHVGDVFYNIQPYENEDGTVNPDAGKAWRWSQNDAEHNGWHWHPIADSDAVKALQLAQMSVLETDVLFIQTSSPTSTPQLPTVNSSGIITDMKGWSTDAPEWAAGMYIWQTTYVRKGDGAASFSDPTCVSGKDGADGADGTSVTITSTSIQYASSSNGTFAPLIGWGSTIPNVPAGQYLWTRTIVNYSDGKSTTSYSVSRAGINGEEGVGISSITNKYAVSSSNTTPPTSWSNNVPTMTATNRYLWNYEIIKYTDGGNSETEKRVIGVYGNTGSPGAAGKGIQSITEHYLASASSSGVTTSTAGWTTTMQTMTATKRYLWNYETIKYTDGTSPDSTPVIIGVYGDQGIPGADGRGIVSTAIAYQIGASGTTAPTGTWSTSVPTAQKGKYLWTRTTVTYTTGNPTVLYSVAYYATDGTDGNDGLPGKDGVGITSTVIKYAKSTSGTTAPTSGWQPTVPSVPAGQYLWTWTQWTYSDNTKEDGYSVAKQGDNGADGTSVTITSTEIRYAKGNYPSQPADSAFTLTSIGTLTKGQYLWTRTIVNYSDGEQTKSYTVAYIGTDGADGIGIPGADGKTSYVHFAYASGITGSLPHPTSVTGFKTLAFAGAKYIGVCTDFSQADPTAHTSYEWSEYKGADGEDGVGIASIVEQYYLSSSRTVLQGGSWSDTPPAWKAGWYYWTRSKITYTDGRPAEYTEGICVTGEAGTSVLAQYSANGSSWHATFQSGDIYMRTSSDNGSTWSPKMPLVGSNYTPNLITDSDFKVRGSWSFHTNVAIDPTHKHEGRNSVKSAQSGLTASAFRGISYYYSEDVKEGDVFTASIWTYAEDLSSIDAGVRLELWGYKDSNRVGTSGSISIQPTKANEWQQFHISHKMPATANRANLYAWVGKNGTVWFASPKLERGNNPSPVWSPAASEMVGKEGQWRKFQWAKNTSTTTAPTSGWQDTPMTPAAGEYVWMRSGIVVPPATEPSSWDTATRLTGDKGESGESTYMLDLSNEVAGIACDANGNVTGDYPISQATVYKGATKVTSGIVYSIAGKTGINASVTTAGKVVMLGMTADTASVTVQAVVDGITLQSALSLYKVRPGQNGAPGAPGTPGADGEDGEPATVYSILPSVSSVSRKSDGTSSVSQVKCVKYSTTGSAGKVITTQNYLYGWMDTEAGTTAPMVIADNTKTEGLLHVAKGIKALYFELRDATGLTGYTVLDRERVPVLADGADIIEQINDAEYLKQVFPKEETDTEITGGVVLTNIVGVRGVDSNDIEAFINGSDLGKSTIHGKLLIAGGIPSTEDYPGVNLSARAQYAKTRIYEDGTIETSKLIALDGAKIGKFVISGGSLFIQSPITATGDNKSMLLGSDYLEWNNTKTGATCRMGARYEYEAALSVFRDTSQNYTSSQRIGIDVSVDTNASENIGIHVSCYGGSNNYAIKCYSGLFAGLRPNIRTVTTTSVTLNEYDHTIVVNTTSAVTIYLPSSPKLGQVYNIIHTTTGTLTFNRNNGSSIKVVSSNTIVTTLASTNREMWTFIYDGMYWDAILTKS